MRVNNQINQKSYSNFTADTVLPPAVPPQKSDSIILSTAKAKIPTHALIYSAATVTLSVGAFFLGKHISKKNLQEAGEKTIETLKKENAELLEKLKTK